MKQTIKIITIWMFAAILVDCTSSKSTSSLPILTDESILAKALAIHFTGDVEIALTVDTPHPHFFWEDKAPALQRLGVPDSIILQLYNNINKYFIENIHTGKVQDTWNIRSPIFKSRKYRNIKFTPEAMNSVSKPVFNTTGNYALITITTLTRSSLPIKTAYDNNIPHYEAYTSAYDMVFEMHDGEWKYISEYMVK
ncbi:MAG: hypothetical protein LBV72_03555 [Tannerella sp.]|jgi:hypothetical protein|nr:hypothetical protein [Tannerella sp.]